MDLQALRDRVPARHRRRMLEWTVSARRPTARLRPLPDFVIIGTQRGGTSSLFKYLSGHPRLRPSLRKEVGFLARRFDQGTAWYRAHWPLRSNGSVAFEATPIYLDHPAAPGRARQVIPDARFVVLLRDPVSRAFSHHQHMTRLGFETLPFEEAIEMEESRIAPARDRLLEPGADDRNYQRFCYAFRGRYADHLERWLEQFPRDRFLFVWSEEFYENPAGELARVLEFIGLDPDWAPPEFVNFSYRGRPRPQMPRIPAPVAARLDSYFSDQAGRLASLTGRMPHW